MATLLQDHFTEGSDTNLASHTMDVGGGWTSFSGTWTVVAASDKAQPPSNQANSGCYADAGAGDVVLTFDFVLPATGNYALGANIRVVDVDNDWIVVFEADAGGGGGDSHRCDLIERNAASNSIRRTATLAGAILGTTMSVTITTSGNNIDVSWVGGTGGSLTQWTSAHPNASVNSSTKFGLYAYTATGTYQQSTFDEFLVTGGAAGGLPIPVAMAHYRQKRQYRQRPDGLWIPDVGAECHDERMR